MAYGNVNEGEMLCKLSVQCEDTDKAPVQCEDDQFGFNAQVVFGDVSVLLRRCTPFLTTLGRAFLQENMVVTQEMQENAGQVQDETAAAGQDDLNITTDSSVSENREDAQGRANSNLGFIDGGPPGAMAVGGMGNRRIWQAENLAQLAEEEGDKRLDRKKKKAGKRAKSRRIHRRKGRKDATNTCLK